MVLADNEAYEIGAILSQMREEYWQGLAEEEAPPKELLECLVFTLGGERCAFETRHASEVIRIPKLVRVPAVQSLIAGVFNLRGEITAAMDVRPLLGLPQPEIGAAGRILVVKSKSFATGILAEAAIGVQGLRLESFQSAPAGERRQFVSGHFQGGQGDQGDQGAIALIDMESLLASPLILAGE